MTGSVIDIQLPDENAVPREVVAGHLSCSAICTLLVKARNRGRTVRIKNAKILTAEERRVLLLHGAGHMLLEW